MPVSFGVREGLDCRRLAGPLGERPLIRKFTGERPVDFSLKFGTLTL